MKYVIYTDGACSVNKRLGGYAAIAKFDGQQIVVHGNKKNATNNEMELLAVISILQIIDPIRGDIIKVYSDSAYVVNAISLNWIGLWKNSNWKTKEKKSIKNKKLWMLLYEMLASYTLGSIECSFIKVKGHGDCKLNNYVDRLAVKEVELLKQLED